MIIFKTFQGLENFYIKFQDFPYFSRICTNPVTRRCLKRIFNGLLRVKAQDSTAYYHAMSLYHFTSHSLSQLLVWHRVWYSYSSHIFDFKVTYYVLHRTLDSVQSITCSCACYALISEDLTEMFCDCSLPLMRTVYSKMSDRQLYDSSTFLSHFTHVIC